MEVQFLEFSDLSLPNTMFTLQTSFKPLLLKEGGGGWINSLVEGVTVNSKEENS